MGYDDIIKALDEWSGREDREDAEVDGESEETFLQRH
jgi:hypothetical protein